MTMVLDISRRYQRDSGNDSDLCIGILQGLGHEEKMLRTALWGLLQICKFCFEKFHFLGVIWQITHSRHTGIPLQVHREQALGAVVPCFVHQP